MYSTHWNVYLLEWLGFLWKYDNPRYTDEIKTDLEHGKTLSGYMSSGIR